MAAPMDKICLQNFSDGYNFFGIHEIESKLYYVVTELSELPKSNAKTLENYYLEFNRKTHFNMLQEFIQFVNNTNWAYTDELGWKVFICEDYVTTLCDYYFIYHKNEDGIKILYTSPAFESESKTIGALFSSPCGILSDVMYRQKYDLSPHTLEVQEYTKNYVQSDMPLVYGPEELEMTSLTGKPNFEYNADYIYEHRIFKGTLNASFMLRLFFEIYHQELTKSLDTVILEDEISRYELNDSIIYEDGGFGFKNYERQKSMHDHEEGREHIDTNMACYIMFNTTIITPSIKPVIDDIFKKIKTKHRNDRANLPDLLCSVYAINDIAMNQCQTRYPIVDLYDEQIDETYTIPKTISEFKSIYVNGTKDCTLMTKIKILINMIS